MAPEGHHHTQVRTLVRRWDLRRDASFGARAHRGVCCESLETAPDQRENVARRQLARESGDQQLPGICSLFRADAERGFRPTRQSGRAASSGPD